MSKEKMSPDEKPKKSKAKTIIIVLVVLLVLGGVIGSQGNKDKGDSEAASTEEAEKTLSTDIIWKEDDNIGILNLELDGTKTKQGIIAQYYTDMSSYLKDLDKSSLKDYDSLRVVGNVMKDGKIECTIKGDLGIDYIKTSDRLSPADLESNIDNLFMPKPLR